MQAVRRSPSPSPTPPPPTPSPSAAPTPKPTAAAVPGRSGATPALELAAICAELARRGRVETVAASVAAPASAGATAGRATPGEPAELTIVIPTLDATSRARARLRRRHPAATEAPHQIVVVDNGAPPQGFTAPVNAGLRAVDTPYAVVMNDDVEVLPGWWQPLRAALDAGASRRLPADRRGGMREDFAAWCFALSAPTLSRDSPRAGRVLRSPLRGLVPGHRPAAAPAGDRPPAATRARVPDPPRALDHRRQQGPGAARLDRPRTIAADRAAFLRKHPHCGAT